VDGQSAISPSLGGWRLRLNDTQNAIGCNFLFWIQNHFGFESTQLARQVQQERTQNTLGGADFEIIPTNNILPAHHLWAGSLHFPPRAGCFFHGRQVRPGKSEATRPIPWYQDRASYAPLRSRFRCWWARQWHIIANIGWHCLFKIGTLSQNQYWFWQRKLAQLLYLVVSLFCTRSRGLVLKPQSLPHQVK